jgi:hypothetical protein
MKPHFPTLEKAWPWEQIGWNWCLFQTQQCCGDIRKQWNKKKFFLKVHVRHTQLKAWLPNLSASGQPRPFQCPAHGWALNQFEPVSCYNRFPWSFHVKQARLPVPVTWNKATWHPVAAVSHLITKRGHTPLGWRGCYGIRVEGWKVSKGPEDITGPPNQPALKPEFHC